MAVPFLLKVELIPSSPGSGITVLQKGTLRSTFPGTWDRNSQNVGNVIFLQGRIDSKLLCVCQSLLDARRLLIQRETSCSAQHPKFHVRGSENPISLAIIPHTLPDESSTANEEESSKNVFE